MFPNKNSSKAAFKLAIKTLSQIQLHETNSSLALSRTIKKLKVKDWGAISYGNRLVKEIVRRKNVIDKIISLILTDTTFNDLSPDIQSFLRLFIFETKLAAQGGMSAHTIAGLGRSIMGWDELSPVEEALGRVLGFNIKALFKGVSDDEKVALKTFHPIWFVRYCRRLIGRREALSLLNRNMELPPLYLRVNTLRGQEENILSRIKTEGIITEPVGNMQFLHKIKETAKPITKTLAFKDGLFYIQDKSSCLAAEVCNPPPESTVIDVCAAPGGKTTYLAQLMKNEGRIYSIDYSGRRMRIFIREILRMGVKIAHPIIADAYNSLPINTKADLVLLDPPCSSTGAFWRTPSAKWRMDLFKIRHLSTLQYNMLESSADHVKLGGSLVYSTCSVMLEENEYLIEKFLKNYPNFTLMDTEPKIGLPALRGQTGAQRLYPHIHDSNGYYIAKLRKFMD